MNLDQMAHRLGLHKTTTSGIRLFWAPGVGTTILKKKKIEHRQGAHGGMNVLPCWKAYTRCALLVNFSSASLTGYSAFFWAEPAKATACTVKAGGIPEQSFIWHEKKAGPG